MKLSVINNDHFKIDVYSVAYFSTTQPYLTQVSNKRNNNTLTLIDIFINFRSGIRWRTLDCSTKI